MIHTEIQTEPIIDERNEAVTESFRTETEISLLDLLVLMVEHKRFMVQFVLGACVLAIIVSLLLPNQIRRKGSIASA